jgi:hypothetical protein
MDDLIKCERFETARDFLDAISLRGPFFRQVEPDAWIFRGHCRSEYELVPSAHRPAATARLSRLAHATSGAEMDLSTQIGRIFAEFMFLNEFWTTADKHGLPTPEDSQKWRTDWRELGRSLNTCYSNPTKYASAPPWPHNEHHSLMALAQHHGVPTRLLDWTRTPLAAAYFAAIPDGVHAKTDGTADVWALNLALAISPRIETVMAPRSANPNLHAQDGLFTIVTNLGVPVKPTERFAPRPLDQCVSDAARRFGWKSGNAAMYRFSFPRSIAGEVLWWLARERVTAAAFFPGYDGVARAVMEIEFSQSPSGPTS